MIEFEPEFEFTMKARYKDAVAEVYNHSDMFEGDKLKDDIESPSSQRKHVFDFHDGCRLAISRERMIGAISTILHISASFRRGYTNEEMSEQELLALAIRHTNELRGKEMQGAIRVLFCGPIVHLLYDENQLVPPADPRLN